MSDSPYNVLDFLSATERLNRMEGVAEIIKPVSRATESISSKRSLVTCILGSVIRNVPVGLRIE